MKDLWIREKRITIFGLRLASKLFLKTWLENSIRGAKDANYKYSVDKEINKRRKKDENNIKVNQIKEYKISFTGSNILSLGVFLSASSFWAAIFPLNSYLDTQKPEFLKQINWQISQGLTWKPIFEHTASRTFPMQKKKIV